jgi:hypothetical protein
MQVSYLLILQLLNQLKVLLLVHSVEKVLVVF